MKSKIKQLIYFAICAPAIMLLVAWPGSKAMAQKAAKPLNPKLQAIAKGGSTPEWVYFRDGSNIKPEAVFTEMKSSFDLSADDEMKTVKTEKDNIGFTHYRYQQYYKNVKVLYGEYIIHQQPDGFVNTVNGRLITGLNLQNKASLSESQALTNALSFMNAKKYLWQNPAMESELKRQQKNQSATYFPKGELVYAPVAGTEKYSASNYRLAWNFKIYTDDKEVPAKTVFVDAATGQVIHSTDISMSCSGGTGTTAFNGTQGISTQLSGGNYLSHNDCQATDIYVYNCAGGGAANNLYNNGTSNTWSDQSAVQCQFGAAMTYSYYLGQHSRTSWDNAAGDMIAYNNANAGQNNACWGCTGNSTIFYAGNTNAATDDWNTDDIVGHEFTHGVTQATAGLVYDLEPGALNESYSDIFGEMVESWTEGSCDYLVGADRGAIRSFINPNTYFNPGTYLGTYWYTGTADHHGVHTNSGVQNHWFYLLSEGGSGTNDFGVPYSVTGIKRFKARDIAYRALTMYENSSSQYIDARAATIQAAYDLYGQCSAEVIAVGDAWHAVGVESQSGAYVINVCGAVASGDFKQAISELQGGNGCSNTINAGSSITIYTARDRVRLFPGFTAPAGSKFIAYLEPCSSTRYRSANDGVIMSDPEKGIKPIVPIASAREAVKATTPADESIAINPNPFTTGFELSINSRQDVKTRVTIFNSLGAKVNAKDGINISKGFNKISFDGSNLSKGVYMVEIMMGDVKTIKKIVKM